MTRKHSTANINAASLALTMSVVVCLGAAVQFDAIQVANSRSGQSTLKSTERQVVARVLGNFSRAVRQMQGTPCATIGVRLTIAPINTAAVGVIYWPDEDKHVAEILNQPHLLNIPPPTC